MFSIVDTENSIKGIIDAIFKRMLDKNIDVYNAVVVEIMTKNPSTVDYREMTVNS